MEEGLCVSVVILKNHLHTSYVLYMSNAVIVKNIFKIFQVILPGSVEIQVSPCMVSVWEKSFQ